MPEPEEEYKAFSIASKGFDINFPNGIRLSTKFGAYTFCEGGRTDVTSFSDNPLENMGRLAKSDNVEIAIIDDEGNFITEEAALEALEIEKQEQIMADVSLENWIKVLNWCNKQKKVEKKSHKEARNRLALL